MVSDLNHILLLQLPEDSAQNIQEIPVIIIQKIHILERISNFFIFLNYLLDKVTFCNIIVIHDK